MENRNTHHGVQWRNTQWMTLMENTQKTSMETTPFKTIRKVMILSRKHFHTIYRSKSVASISNETDPEGKTKILMILQIKLPHWNGIDNLKVKVDSGAVANIFTLRFFQDHASSCIRWERLPKSRNFWGGPGISLECYNDGRLVNHDSIKLKIQHYSDKSFQDYYFYVIETKTTKVDHHWTSIQYKVRSHMSVR